MGISSSDNIKQQTCRSFSLPSWWQLLRTSLSPQCTPSTTESLTTTAELPSPRASRGMDMPPLAATLSTFLTAGSRLSTMSTMVMVSPRTSATLAPPLMDLLPELLPMLPPSSPTLSMLPPSSPTLSMLPLSSPTPSMPLSSPTLSTLLSSPTLSTPPLSSVTVVSLLLTLLQSSPTLLLTPLTSLVKHHHGEECEGP